MHDLALLLFEQVAPLSRTSYVVLLVFDIVSTRIASLARGTCVRKSVGLEHGIVA
jgi:hypothetical protein